MITFENWFCEAEDKIRDDPMGAIELFDQIINGEKEKYGLEDRKQSFQSLKVFILLDLSTLLSSGPVSQGSQMLLGSI